MPFTHLIFPKMSHKTTTTTTATTRHYRWYRQRRFLLFRLYPKLDLSCDLSKANDLTYLTRAKWVGCPNPCIFKSNYSITSLFCYGFSTTRCLVISGIIVKSKYQSSFPPSAGALLPLKRIIVCFPVSPIIKIHQVKRWNWTWFASE